jgi:hypothetical protein
MSSRTVKWLLLASVLLIAFPVVAGASSSRIAGMGIQGDYIKDYTNVYTYLSNVSCVGNVVYGELGNWDSHSDTYDRAVGAIIGNLFDGKFGTIGIRLSEETSQLGQADANTPIGAGYDGWDPNSNTNHSFDLLWGKKFGTMSLGLQMNRSYARLLGDPVIDYGYNNPWNDIKGDDPWSALNGYPEDLTYDRNILGFGGGVGLELSPKLSVEGSILFQSRTFMAKDTLYDHNMFVGSFGSSTGYLPYYNNELISIGQKWENDGSAAYLMAARAMWQAQPNLLVVPVFKFYSMNADAKAEFWVPEQVESNTAVKVAFTPLEDKYSGWQLGLAGNWTVNEKDLFVLGASFASNKETEKYTVVDYSVDGAGNYVYTAPYLLDEYKYTETMMPMVFAALETHVNSWLTLRLGAQQGVFYTWKYQERDLYEDGTVWYDNTTTEHYSPFTMMLGAGFKFGNLQLDATVNPDFVHNGPYFITGETTGYSNDYSDAMFPRVSATYTF